MATPSVPPPWAPHWPTSLPRLHSGTLRASSLRVRPSFRGRHGASLERGLRSKQDRRHSTNGADDASAPISCLSLKVSGSATHVSSYFTAFHQSRTYRCRLLMNGQTAGTGPSKFNGHSTGNSRTPRRRKGQQCGAQLTKDFVEQVSGKGLPRAKWPVNQCG